MAGELFISYASKDRETAETLCAALESRGFSCWLSSRNVEPGDNFQESIVRAIRAAKVMLFVFSANSNNSDEVKKEIALASRNKMLVIPLRVEDVLPNEAFDYEFATRQWIDLFNDWEHSLGQLVAQILRIVPPNSGIASDESGEAVGGQPEPPRRRRARLHAAADVEPTAAAPNANQVRGDAYAKIGKYDLAIAEYDQAVRQNPLLAAAFHNRGTAHQASGANELAIVDFDEAIRLRPDHASAFNNRGNTYLNMGDHARAVSDFDEAIRLKPDFALAFNNRGFAEFGRGDYNRAIEDFSAALRLKPDLAIALENRAKAYERKGLSAYSRDDRATAGKIASASPSGGLNQTSDPPAKNNTVLIITVCVGFVLLLFVFFFIVGVVASQSSASADAAASSADSATAAASDAAAAAVSDSSQVASNTDASAATDDVWANCKTGSETIAGCSAVINAHNETPENMAVAYSNRGLVYYNASDYDKGIDDYDQAIAIDGKNYLLYFNRAVAYDARKADGDLKRALDDYQRAIDLKSDYAPAYYYRGVTKRENGDPAGGADDIATAKKMDPTVGN